MRGNETLISTILAIAFCLPPLAQARQLSVQDSSIGTYIAERTPYGTATHFSSGVGELFAFTRIVGAEGDSWVTHKWYYGEQLMAEVQLRVGADSWRTWSSKRVRADWVGEWRVEVIAEDGTKLDTITFTVS
jgi:hypothetical protein